MQKISNTLTACFAVAILYTFWCLWEAVNMSTEMTVVKAIVKDPEGVVRHDLLKDNTVRRGDTIFVTFSVPARKVAGWNHIERHLIDASNTEYIVSTMDRSWKANSPLLVEGSYPIPKFVNTGCGANIFSVSHYTIHYNMLTWAMPLIGTSPRLSICIE